MTLDKTQIEILREQKICWLRAEMSDMVFDNSDERLITAVHLQDGWDAAIDAVLALAATAAPKDDDVHLLKRHIHLLKRHIEDYCPESQSAAPAKEVECPSCEGWLLDQRPQVDGMCEVCNGTGKIVELVAPAGDDLTASYMLGVADERASNRVVPSQLVQTAIQEPEGWRKFLEDCTGCNGISVHGDHLAREAWRLLNANPNPQPDAAYQAGFADAINQATFYVRDHCNEGERHAEAISEMQPQESKS